MQISWKRLPFAFTTLADYQARLNDYIGDLFYQQLPEVGYEVREEQIYAAFRIAGALTGGKLLLAEAALGTGKTLAYLIPAICHARLKGRPVVIASAGAVLQEQLLAPDGDLAQLARVLGARVDARLAKDPRQYLCELKVERLRERGDDRPAMRDLLAWAEGSALGDRAEIPAVADELWEQAGWDASQPCDTCPRRGYCRLTRAREHYRGAADLVVCDHDLFFRDLWTREERQAAGLRPLLPPYCAVVFDEGHEIADAAQRSAGQNLRPDVLRRLLEEAAESSDRGGLLRAVSAARQADRTFWAEVGRAVLPAEAARLHVQRSEALQAAARELGRQLAVLQDELATEEAMQRETDEEVRLLALQATLDAAQEGLRMLSRPPEETVAWAARIAGPEPGGRGAGRGLPSGRVAAGYELWVVPRRIDRLLQAELYSQKIPVVLSSATLASGRSFAYTERVLGLTGAATCQVGTPFDLAEQALVYVPAAGGVDALLNLLAAVEGRTLVLLNTAAELQELRMALAGRELPWTLLWEGDGERADLVRRFQADVSSVLLGTSYWEGIDVPGEALSCVAVLKLPFPPHDPVIAARREDAAGAGQEPFAAVDVPLMAVKLKQGRGRLIRSSQDRGIFALLDTSFQGAAYEDAVRGAWPEDAEETGELEAVRAFLGAAVP